jgi:hypothetical protein
MKNFFAKIEEIFLQFQLVIQSLEHVAMDVLHPVVQISIYGSEQDSFEDGCVQE